jgi:hypothetical protein
MGKGVCRDRCASAARPTAQLSRFPPMNCVKTDERSPFLVLQTTGDSRNYAGRESGGARPARWTAGVDGTDRLRDGRGSQPSSFRTKELAFAVNAGGLCHFQTEALSLVICRMVRLLAGDSSISARMARRSSVAEITGKRMTSMHPRVSRHCRAFDLRPARVALDPRHNQYAGSAKSSHTRLSSSSMK